MSENRTALNQALKKYESAKTALLRIRTELFPVPCVVHIDSERYVGMGIVMSPQDHINPNKLSIWTENPQPYNDRHFDIKDCVRVDKIAEWPLWIKGQISLM